MDQSEPLSTQTALAHILATIKPTDTETIPLEQADNRVLAEPIRSTLDLPAFTNSGMDGFAVRPGDVVGASRETPVELVVVGDIPAGSMPDGSLAQGQAMRIMTGAPLPEGAGAVVPVEQTDQAERALGNAPPASVRIFRPVESGDFVRPKGGDLIEGEQVLREGVRLRSQDVGILAMLGNSHVRVFRRPRVAIISTGDELVPIDQVPLAPGKIRESNSYMLASLVTGCGGEVLRLGIVSDDLEAMMQQLDAAYEAEADLIISTAGVSVGAFDFVRSALESNGAIEFWRVKMRPGKPLVFGRYRDIPFAGLPGNPVSAFVGFEVFLRPALNRMGGDDRWMRPEAEASLIHLVDSDGRESYLRGILSEEAGKLWLRDAAHQGSGNLFSLVKANALYIIPEGVKSLPAGSTVKFWPV